MILDERKMKLFKKNKVLFHQKDVSWHKSIKIIIKSLDSLWNLDYELLASQKNYR